MHLLLAILVFKNNLLLLTGIVRISAPIHATCNQFLGSQMEIGIL